MQNHFATLRCNSHADISIQFLPLGRELPIIRRCLLCKFNCLIFVAGLGTMALLLLFIKGKFLISLPDYGMGIFLLHYRTLDL